MGNRRNALWRVQIRSFPPRPRSGQRVVLEHQLLQPLFEHVRIDLRGRDIGMAQQLLHRAQVGAAIEQMAGEGVAQDVRRHPLGVDARFRRQLLQFLRRGAGA